jgi:hypothetical protein
MPPRHFVINRRLNNSSAWKRTEKAKKRLARESSQARGRYKPSASELADERTCRRQIGIAYTTRPRAANGLGSRPAILRTINAATMR